MAGNKYNQDTIQTGAGLASKRLGANIGLENEYDTTANLFGDIKKQFSGANNKPRGIDALVSGLASGAEYGYKLKGVKTRKDELEKFNKVMDYFESVNMDAQKRIEKYQNEEAKKEAMRPYATAATEMMYSGEPYENILSSVRNVWEQVKNNNPEIKGDLIGFIPNSSSIIYRDDNGKQNVYSLDQIVGDDNLKRINNNYLEQQQLALKQKGLGIQQGYLDLEKQYAPQKIATMQNRIDQTTKRNEISEALQKSKAMSNTQKTVETYAKNIDSNQHFIKRAPEMIEIAKKYPDIFKSVWSAVVSSPDDPSKYEEILSSVASSLSDQDKVAALDILKKDVNRMVLDVAGGFTKPNMFIEKIGSKAVPNPNMTAEAFIKSMRSAVEEKEQDNKLYLKRINAFNQTPNVPLNELFNNEAQKETENQSSPNGIDIKSLSDEDIKALLKDLGE